MITQKDVAEKAGVSFITVSRVVNNEGNVKATTFTEKDIAKTSFCYIIITRIRKG